MANAYKVPIEMKKLSAYIGLMSDKRGRPTTITLEDCDSAIKSFIQFCREMGFQISSPNYIKWQKQHSDYPTITQIIRFDTWNNSLQRISPTSRVQHNQWTEKECLHVLKRFSSFCTELGYAPTVRRYNAWRMAHEAPTSTTIWRVFGSWPLSPDTKIKKAELKPSP